MTHCFNSIREAQTSPNTGVREILSKETVVKWQSLLIISGTQPGSQGPSPQALVHGNKASLAPRPSPQALVHGNKASLNPPSFPSLGTVCTEGDGKLGGGWERG